MMKLKVQSVTNLVGKLLCTPKTLPLVQNFMEKITIDLAAHFAKIRVAKFT